MPNNQINALIESQKFNSERIHELAIRGEDICDNIERQREDLAEIKAILRQQEQEIEQIQLARAKARGQHAFLGWMATAVAIPIVLMLIEKLLN